MPRARDVAFIRKLCGMPLPQQTLAQCRRPELRRLVPSHSAGVFWVDALGEMTSLYAERMLPPEAMAAYYLKHYSADADSFADVFRRRAAEPDPISFHSFSKAEQSSGYFRDVMAALDAYHVLYGVVRTGNQPIAQVSFYRGRGDKPFGKIEADALRSVIRYLGVGLASTAPSLEGDDSAVITDEELGIVSRTGTLVNAPEGWYRLMRLAALAEVSPRNAARERSTIEGFVESVHTKLAAAHGAENKRELIHETAWGRFAIRTFSLPDPKGRRAEQIALLIRREEPRSLSLVRGAGMAALSSQQREVALLLAAGKSNREIGEELGLTFNTASYHVKQVYARLEVNERAAVAQKLLGFAQEVAAY